MTFSKFNQKRFQKPIPVKEGEEYDVTIENVGEKGDGIAKVKGYVIIVPQTKKGERVRIKVTRISQDEKTGSAADASGIGTSTAILKAERTDCLSKGWQLPPHLVYRWRRWRPFGRYQ